MENTCYIKTHPQEQEQEQEQEEEEEEEKEEVECQAELLFVCRGLDAYWKPDHTPTLGAGAGHCRRLEGGVREDESKPPCVSEDLSMYN